MDPFTGLGPPELRRGRRGRQEKVAAFDIAYLIVPRSDDQVPSLLKWRRASMPLQRDKGRSL